MLIADPIGQELMWRGVAERGMLSPAVVEQLGVVKGVSSSCLSRFVASAMHPLILVPVEETLGRRIVLAVALAAHRANHAVILQLRLEGATCILYGFN